MSPLEPMWLFCVGLRTLFVDQYENDFAAVCLFRKAIEALRRLLEEDKITVEEVYHTVVHMRAVLRAGFDLPSSVIKALEIINTPNCSKEDMIHKLLKIEEEFKRLETR